MKKKYKKRLAAVERETLINAEILDACGNDIERIYEATDPWNSDGATLLERVRRLEVLVESLIWE